MNLVTCSEDCRHQKNGTCRLKDNSAVASAAKSGCYYYQQRKNNPQKSQAKK